MANLTALIQQGLDRAKMERIYCSGGGKQVPLLEFGGHHAERRSGWYFGSNKEQISFCLVLCPTQCHQ